MVILPKTQQQKGNKAPTDPITQMNLKSMQKEARQKGRDTVDLQFHDL